MADALCGPSNALQNFQKQASIDRTLQQDRLLARHSPSQGFRSSPGPNAGILDPEFEAFQAGLTPFQPELHSAQYRGGQSLQNFAPSHDTGWASDFQRLQVSEPASAIHHQSFQSQVPVGQNAGQNWSSNFRQTQMGSNPVQTSQMQNGMNYTYGGMNAFGMQAPMPYGQDFSGMGPVAQAGQQAELFDDAAFERAFDAARSDMIQEEQVAQDQAIEETSAEVLIDASAENFMRAEPEILTERIGADTIEDSRESEKENPQQESDELARTAGHLLESVQDNTSQKFQQSNFLALMRKLRDREVVVDGDKMVEVGVTTPHHPQEQSSLDQSEVVPAASIENEMIQPTMTGANAVNDVAETDQRQASA